MANNVNYHRLNVNFFTMLQKLHEAAKNMAQQKNQDIQFYNLLFEGPEPKCLLYMTNKDKTPVKEVDKSKFVEYTSEYVKWFTGSTIGTEPSEDGNQITINNDSLIGMKSPELLGKIPNAPSSQTSESFFNYIQFQDFVFESQDIVHESSATSATSQLSGQNDEQTYDGFGLPYTIEIKKQSVDDSYIKDQWNKLERKTKGMVSGALADVMNLKFYGRYGGTIQVKDFIGHGKIKGAVGKVDIDVKTVGNDIKYAFNNEFPNNKVQIKYWTTAEIQSLIGGIIDDMARRNYGRVNELSSSLQKNQYAITVNVDSTDVNYMKYNPVTIAKVCSRAFGTYYNIVDWNGITDKDVFKIDNYKDIDINRKNNRNQDTQNVGITSKNPNSNEVSTADSKATNTAVKESIENIQSPVQNCQYKDILRNRFADYVSHTLKDYDLKQGTDFGMVPVSEFVDNLKFQNIDKGVIEQLKKNGGDVLFVKIHRDFGNQLEESQIYSGCNDLLNILFESTGSYSGEADYDQLVRNIGYTKPMNDMSEYHRMMHNVKDYYRREHRIDGIHDNICKKMNRIFGNSVIKTQRELHKFIHDVPSYDVKDMIFRTSEDQVQESDVNDAKTYPDKMINRHFRLADGYGRMCSCKNGTGHFSVISNRDRIHAYLVNHGLDADSGMVNIKNPYVGMIMEVRDRDYDPQSSGEFDIQDSDISQVIDRTIGKVDNLTHIKCEQIKKMNGSPYEVITQDIGSRGNRHPYVDVWLFGIDDKINESIDNDCSFTFGKSNVVVDYIFAMSDPFYHVNAEEIHEEQISEADNTKYDMYIITSPKFKDLARSNTKTRNPDGSTELKASDAEYKPSDIKG